MSCGMQGRGLFSLISFACSVAECTRTGWFPGRRPKNTSLIPDGALRPPKKIIYCKHQYFQESHKIHPTNPARFFNHTRSCLRRRHRSRRTVWVLRMQPRRPPESAVEAQGHGVRVVGSTIRAGEAWQSSGIKSREARSNTLLFGVLSGSIEHRVCVMFLDM